MLLNNKIISMLLISGVLSSAYGLNLSKLTARDLRIIEDLKENSIETSFNSDFLKKKFSKDIGVKQSIIIRDSCKDKNGIVLRNGYVSTCVTPDGTFGAKNNQIGMTFNPNGDSITYQDDYLQPGIPWEYFSVSIGDSVYTNNNSGSGIPFSSTNISPLGTLSFVEGEEVLNGILVKSTIGAYPNLKIVQEYTLDPLSNSIKIRVSMTNTGYSKLGNIKYARGLDPDSDKQRFNNFRTLNRRGYNFLKYPLRISDKDIAWSIGQESGKMVSLYSVDPIKHNTCISPSWTTNPNKIYSSSTPSCISRNYPKNYTNGDYTINIAFNIGYLAPKETKVILFKYIFDKPKEIMPLEKRIIELNYYHESPSIQKK